MTPKSSDSSGGHTIKLDQTMGLVSNQKAIRRGHSVLVNHLKDEEKKLMKSGMSQSSAGEAKPKFSDSKWDPKSSSSEEVGSVPPDNEIGDASKKLTDSVDVISSILYLVLDKLSLQRYLVYGMIILFISLVYSNIQLRSAVKTLESSNEDIVSVRKSLETSPEEILAEIKKAVSAIHEAREKEESKAHIELVPGDKDGELAVIIHPPVKEETKTKEPETEEPEVKELLPKIVFSSRPKMGTPVMSMHPKPRSWPRMKKKRSSVRIPIKVRSRVRESL